MSSKKETSSERIFSKKNYNETWWFPILLIVISVFISAVVGYIIFQIQWSNSIQNEQKNLANGYLNDLEVVNTSLLRFEQSFYDTNYTGIYQTPFRYNEPLYPDWGLYYSNRQDIGKFETNLSQNLTNFYYKVLTAESQRKVFNNYDAEFPYPLNDPILAQNHRDSATKIFWLMADNINESRKKISPLMTELRNVSNS